VQEVEPVEESVVEPKKPSFGDFFRRMIKAAKPVSNVANETAVDILYCHPLPG
jgi:hypothetical protein